MANDQPRRPTPVAPPVPRRPTPPGPPVLRLAEYSSTFSEEEEPTQPGAAKPSDRFDTVARLFANLTPDERSRAALLLDNWFRCPANRRVLLEATAAEFSD